MIVRCIREYPSEEQMERFGTGFYRDQGFGLVVGKDYLVLAMSFYVQSNLLGTAACVYVMAEDGRYRVAPLALFDILDARPSRLWDARLWDDGTLTLWPPSWYQEFYHDILTDGEQSIVRDFEWVCAVLEFEATGQWLQP